MRTLIGLLLAMAAAFTLAACGGSTDEAAPAVSTETQTADPSREKAPDVEGETLDGTTITLADFRGKPVLVNVWSSW